MCNMIDHLMSGCRRPNDWPSNGRDGRDDGDKETFNRCAIDLPPECQRGNPRFRPAQDRRRELKWYDWNDGLYRDCWEAEQKRKRKVEQKAKDIQDRNRENGESERAWQCIESRSRR
nr:hypothetical protein B0A51_11742 [Rachicladosporium sp. CCFEE 5018]